MLPAYENRHVRNSHIFGAEASCPFSETAAGHYVPNNTAVMVRNDA